MCLKVLEIVSLATIACVGEWVSDLNLICYCVFIAEFSY